MPFEHREGFGSLFPNKYKAGNSKAPDQTGTFMLHGVVWKIAAWDKGNGRLSIQVQPDKQRGESTTSQERAALRPAKTEPAPAPFKDDDLNDLPF